MDKISTGGDRREGSSSRENNRNNCLKSEKLRACKKNIS
jgi:hypothetical protein